MDKNFCQILRSILFILQLRRLESDPELNEVTHLVIDEVHERSMESDFLLMIIRDLLPRRPKACPCPFIQMFTSLLSQVYQKFTQEKLGKLWIK